MERVTAGQDSSWHCRAKPCWSLLPAVEQTHPRAAFLEAALTSRCTSHRTIFQCFSCNGNMYKLCHRIDQSNSSWRGHTISWHLVSPQDSHFAGVLGELSLLRPNSFRLTWSVRGSFNVLGQTCLGKMKHGICFSRPLYT